MPQPLCAGAAVANITPQRSIFLAGYPHVQRDSTGVHDPLLSSALYLQSGSQQALFVANDVLFVSKKSVSNCRRQIQQRTGVPEADILISATHTHSGPKTLEMAAWVIDPALPQTDPQYVRLMEEGIVESACRAVTAAAPAEAGLAVADGTGVGTNRRDPAGPKDLAVPVLVVRHADTSRPLAAMLVCGMHPTVLHEDSTLISGDFPAMARQQLQRNLLGDDCVILYHTGPAGNQSPRHVTRGNTFAEAERLGGILADAAAKVIPGIQFRHDLNLQRRSATVTMPPREFPHEADAEERLRQAVERLRRLRDTGAPRTEVRTAECDWFGAEETLSLSRSAATGGLRAAIDFCMPAEIQVISIGPWNFVAWPGEMFVEFALDVKAQCRNAFIISYANGDLQGYLVTQQAAEEGGYESSNAIFQSPIAGNLLVQKTLELLR